MTIFIKFHQSRHIRYLSHSLHRPHQGFLQVCNFRPYCLTSRNARPKTCNLDRSVVARIQQRGAKRTTKMSIMDLPQGPLSPVEPLEPIVEEKSYPTVIAQARTNMDKFANCVVLTRVGGFYELYFEHAENIGPLLNLKVAQKKTTKGPVSMAGFPHFQIDRMLKVLVQELKQYVAISEEYPNPRRSDPDSPSYGLLHERRVSRIITPGTLIDEKFLDPFENNFLLSISLESNAQNEKEMGVGLAWLDLSTGDFFLQKSTISTLISELSRIGPREVVIPEDLRSHPLVKILYDERHLVSFADRGDLGDVDSWSTYFESDTSHIDELGMTEEEVEAGSLLLYYANEQLQGLSMKLQPPMRKTAENNLLIDANSMRALEIKTTMREGISGGKGTLLKEIKRTVTRGGSRKLLTWLTSPETSVKVINGRLNLVEHILHSPKLLFDIQYQLRLSHDSQRLIQKLSMGRGDADDLIALARTIEATQTIVKLLVANADTSEDQDIFSELLARVDVPTELSRLISKSIDEEGLMLTHRLEDAQVAELVSIASAIEHPEVIEDEVNEDMPLSVQRKEVKRSKKLDVKVKSQRLMKEADREKSEAWVMKQDASKLLTKLHKDLEQLYQSQADLECELRTESGAQSLCLRWTPALGNIVHIKAKDINVSKKGRLMDAKIVGSSRSTHSFHLPEWTHLGSTIEMARLSIRAEEQKVLQDIKKKVLKRLVVLRRNASVLDELDVACSFAILAKEHDLVRPILDTGTSHKIIGGRHLVVQTGLQLQGKSFTTNDCLLGQDDQIWIITGPNMAGKSTFLRQNAIISIMAQTGSFVPADYAEIGVVDQIFSRVGSADNLFKDQSTFMVEMMETAVILKQATRRSFVIMDEIGRGTTPSDGVAIAYACLHHLRHVNQSRVLFATHFHDLVDLSAGLGKVGTYCTDVAEGSDGSFSYVHRLRQGVNRKSHALKVARLAGLPSGAIEIAEQTLLTLEDKKSVT